MDPLLKSACKTDPSQVHHLHSFTRTILPAVLNSTLSFTHAQGTLLGADLHERAAEAGAGTAEVRSKAFRTKADVLIDLDSTRT